MADLTTLLSGFLNNLYVGVIGAGAGSLSAPSISFTGDPNTGFASELADVISVVCGGGRSMLLQGGGVINLRGNSANVIMGTSDDASLSRTGAAALAIGNGTAGDFSGTLKTTVVNAVTGFQQNGTAGVATFGPAAVASITVKGGIVTAIS